MKKHYRALRGTRDILPDEIARWQFLEQSARAVLSRFGFAEIRTPILEATELFARSVGESSDIVRKEMYAFEDKKGRVMALRPEGTPGVIRAYIEAKLHKSAPQQKFYYIGSMFRYERPQAGREREFSQLGGRRVLEASPTTTTDYQITAYTGNPTNNKEWGNLLPTPLYLPGCLWNFYITT